LSKEEQVARVLAIDDDEQMRGMLRDMLRAAGFEVTLAENGEAGLTMFNEAPADLVITDIMMPEVDGLEMIR
jgi:DNA-binding response OmpR family regulator